ncbi:MAG: saccharopine dehydrogenase C-terminal domain-containing protein [Candidatus Eremiobacteraeota bacterium]|nr:saccharopine dehydrogenase C-terminal domain-containing protein [Candidatus Eremiobacteraeota bacterium]
MKKKVLLLGAGLVAKPLVRYFFEKTGHEVIIATRTVKKADDLIEGHPRGRALALDALADAGGLKKAVQEADLVISLLPAVHHLIVAEQCLEAGKPLVTTSYVSPGMAALHDEARQAGLLFLNEMGLDPGIDHMTAMKLFDEAAGKGGRITGFISYCGGLPAPEANTNPFGYKFSWSPRAVLLAAKRPAHFLRDGKEVKVSSEDLFLNCEKVVIPGLGEFEGYPNRDSMSYLATYNLTGMKTMFRGTLRNKTHCESWKQIVDLGLLDEEKLHDLPGKTYRQFMAELLGVTEEHVEKEMASRLKISKDSLLIQKLEWLGFLGSDMIPLQEACALDVLSHRLNEKLKYEKGERDMVVLQHEVTVEYPSEKRSERRFSTLIDYGIPHGDSAMARTVSLPAAIASRMILDGEVSLTGVHIPVQKEFYEPVLAELQDLGILFEERTAELLA